MIYHLSKIHLFIFIHSIGDVPIWTYMYHIRFGVHRGHRTSNHLIDVMLANWWGHPEIGALGKNSRFSELLCHCSKYRFIIFLKRDRMENPVGKKVSPENPTSFRLWTLQIFLHCNGDGGYVRGQHCSFHMADVITQVI